MHISKLLVDYFGPTEPPPPTHTHTHTHTEKSWHHMPVEDVHHVFPRARVFLFLFARLYGMLWWGEIKEKVSLREQGQQNCVCVETSTGL
jgi:hypothetical protein